MSELVLDPIESVSGNDIGNKLDNISFQLDTLSRDLGVSGQALELRGLNDSNQLEGYCVRTGRGEWCYIPVDKVQYFSVTSSGELINMSSSTIYTYSLDSNGNRGTYYRFQPFGTCEYQYTSGYNTYWAYTSALHYNSNITTGQVGVKSFTEVFLVLIFFVLLLIFFFSRRK